MKIGSNSKKDIYHIYELEAHGLNAGKTDLFWRNVIQVFGSFIFMTFVVFFIINFRFISSQLADWYSGNDYDIAVDVSSDLVNSNQSIKYLISGIDQDGDGLTDEIEKVIGTNANKIDSDEDGHSDFYEISNGYNPLGDGRLRAEIEIPHSDSLLVVWQDEMNLSEKTIFKNNNKLIFNDTFVVPLKYVKESFGEQAIIASVYFNDVKIRSFYKEKTREINNDFSETKSFNEGIQFVAGWPEGTDWQKLIINMELVEINLNN